MKKNTEPLSNEMDFLTFPMKIYQTNLGFRNFFRHFPLYSKSTKKLFFSGYIKIVEKIGVIIN